MLQKFFVFFALWMLCGKLSSSQGFLMSYRQLSNIEKKWVRNHPIAALKIKKETKVTRQIVQQLKHEGLLDTLSNGGKIDAFRHAFWMARIAKRIGPKKALTFGEIHEKGNYENFLKNITEDAELQDSISCEMDLLNNKVGIEISKLKATNTNDQLKQIVIEKIKNGGLFILKHNLENKFTDCDNNIIIKQNGTRKKWNINYCLVPSNYDQ